MNIEVKKQNIESIINDYNEDINNKELEFIYKKNITEDKLKSIFTFLNTSLKQKPKLEYILDISIPSISNHHRLSFKTEADDILKSHCLNEKDNNFDSYDLEYKKLLNRYDITDYNIRINLKNEYQETNDEIKKQFYDNYKKFVKEYRFKKRYSYQLNNFTIDISIVKSNKSRNIVIANLSDVLENYEIEIECNKVNINLDIISSILRYMTAFMQISNNSYFITKNSLNQDILQQYQSMLKKHGFKSIGPKPITLTKKTIPNMIFTDDELKDENKLVKDDGFYYKITDKADGDRYYMYINNQSMIYLLNDNEILIQTGLQLPTDSNEFKNSLLDGEYLIYRNPETNKLVYEYKFFDIYISNSILTYNKNLQERIEIMSKLDSIINTSSIKYLHKDVFIKCSQKPYKSISEFNNILINADSRPYNIDGIIFMPTTALANINNVSHHKILKYKPANFNSIDVFIKNNIIHIGFRINYNRYNSYILSELQSFKPYIYNIHKPEFIYDSDLNPILWNTLNNKVIEIRYDKAENKFIFMNFRYDKTIKYNNTNQITANNIDIVQDIISNTFNPLEADYFDNLTESSINKFKSTDNYYTDNISSNNRNEIRRINNLIKRELIQHSVEILETIQQYNDDFSNIKVLDLACGRGGDLYKFIDTNFDSNKMLKKTGGIQFILGIDSDPNNIEAYDNKNDNNNARARFLQYKNQFLQDNADSNTPYIYNNNSVFYITGNINNFEDDDDDIEEVFDTLMDNDNLDFSDRTKYDKVLLDNINTNFDFINLYEKESFELINCQFAIHYFNISMFAKLINLFLKQNGLFICTFMEKEFVQTLLGDDESKSGSFWSIKKSDNPNKILVRFDTKEGDYLEENLVSKNQLIDEFAKYSIKPYSDDLTQLISNRQSPIPSVFDFKNHNKLKFSQNPELDFSKLYSYIIFEKSPAKQNIISGLQNLQ